VHTPLAPVLLPNHPAMRLVPRQFASMSNAQPDSFAEPEAYYEWVANIGLQDMSRGGFGGNGMRQTTRVSSSDSSMPDYISSHHSGRMSLCFPDHAVPHLAGRNINLHHDDVALKVPTNTPIAMPSDMPVFEGSEFAALSRNEA
jgi:hypothetical protein